MHTWCGHGPTGETSSLRYRQIQRLIIPASWRHFHDASVETVAAVAASMFNGMAKVVE